MTDKPEQQAALAFAKKVFLCIGRTFVQIAKLLMSLGEKSLPVLKIIAPPVFLCLALFILLFWTGLGDIIGENLSAFLGPVPAVLIIFAICFIPAVSPLLGPGLLIAMAAGVLSGEQIAAGEAGLILGLTALLAIDATLGGSFIQPGLVMGENEPETISAGVPGIVFTRLITVPAAVALACLFGFKH